MAKGFGRKIKRIKQLETRKDRLQKLNQMIPWQILVSKIEESFNKKQRKSNAGRKPISREILWKMLILQQLYNLSDEEVEYQTHDRISFKRFVGLSKDDEIPDATTINLFRKQLTEAELIEELFSEFDQFLRNSGYEAKGGQIVDATIVPVPRQRNNKEENKLIKQGEIPEDWKSNPHKLQQKDIDARWTKKNQVSYFGYKNHINIDVKHGFIRLYNVTDASVHDSQVLGSVLGADNSGDEIWADSAYRSDNIETGLDVLGHISQINERGYKNKPLSEEQKASNRIKSKTRAKVEHVFGAWQTRMGGKKVSNIGLIRVKTKVGLKNLTYNLLRYIFWEKKKGECLSAHSV